MRLETPSARSNNRRPISLRKVLLFGVVPLASPNLRLTTGGYLPAMKTVAAVLAILAGLTQPPK